MSRLRRALFVSSITLMLLGLTLVSAFGAPSDPRFDWYLPLIVGGAETPPMATPLPSATPSPTAQPLITVPIPNGDFEQGPVVWQPAGSAQQFIVHPPAYGPPAHSGDFNAVLPVRGDVAGTQGLLETTVIVPEEAPYLVYYAGHLSHETCVYGPYAPLPTDRGYIEVYRSDNTFIQGELIPLCGPPWPGWWRKSMMPLGNYIGQSIIVRISVETDQPNDLYSEFYVDDFAFQSDWCHTCP